MPALHPYICHFIPRLREHRYPFDGLGRGLILHLVDEHDATKLPCVLGVSASRR